MLACTAWCNQIFATQRRIKVNGNSNVPTCRIAVFCIILFVFLWNSAVMIITATVFHNCGTFAPIIQNGLLFVERVCRSFTTIITYCVHFFLSTVLVTSHGHLGRRLALHLHNFNLPSLHLHIIAKGYTAFFAFYYTKGLGSAELFELLIYCQITSAVFLIVSAIPLLMFPSFLITGFSISPLFPCLSVFSFIVIISANIIFINETIYNTEWFNDPMENSADNYVSMYYLDILLLSISITLTLYLCFTVLKYLNNMQYKKIKVSGLEDEQSKKHELAKGKFLVEDFVNKSQYPSCDTLLIEQEERKLELMSRSIEEGNVILNEGVRFENNGPEYKLNGSVIHLASGNSLKYLNSMPYKEVKVSGLEDEQSKKHELAEYEFLVKDFVNKRQYPSCDTLLIEQEEKKLELTSCSIEEGNVTLKEGVLFDNNGPESKVKGSVIHLTNNQYGITRADKRQLASILDEFWGLIFDCHGNLTDEAKNMGVSVIFDVLDVESPACTGPCIRTQKDEVALSSGYTNKVFEHAHLTTGNIVNWTQDYLTSFPNHSREDEVVHSAVKKLTWGGKSIYTFCGTQKKQLTYEEVKSLVLHSLKICIRKISSLNCAEWLFCENDGCDEKLIELLASCEKFLNKEEGCDLDEGSVVYLPTISHCDKECIWQVSLVLSFAVWSIRRMLVLVGKETRPELWGKFTYVLNRLQGLLDPIFSNPRAILSPCNCVRASECKVDDSGTVKVTCKRDILELIQEAEAFCSRRKGQAGTAAGDIAFPKGKQNLISAFRRYRRKLSN